MLPYILSEIRDLSGEEEPRRRYVLASDHDDPRRRYVAQAHGGDVLDLLDELLSSRPSALQARAARPSYRPSAGLVRLVEAPESRLLRRQSHPGRPSILQQLRKELGELARPDDKRAFAVNVDVHDYLPEELSVQVTKDDGFVVVEGSHEERPDEHGLVRRHFTRRYKLPDGVDPDTITSKLTPEGVLQVWAPIKALNPPQERVRHVPINCSREPEAQQDEQAHAENQAEKNKQDGKEESQEKKNEP